MRRYLEKYLRGKITIQWRIRKEMEKKEKEKKMKKENQKIRKKKQCVGKKRTALPFAISG